LVVRAQRHGLRQDLPISGAAAGIEGADRMEEDRCPVTAVEEDKHPVRGSRLEEDRRPVAGMAGMTNACKLNVN